jgi:hypothetical protein
MKIFLRAALLASTSMVFISCAKSGSDPAPATSNVVAESSYCSNSSTISDGLTITATAQFQARNVTILGLQGASAAQNIRFAEVQVLDSSGNVIQCGVTNGSGNVVATDQTSPLRIPKTSGSYTLKVNSRANNSKLAVSVLNNPYDNKFHSISSSFSVSGYESSINVTLPTASHTDTLEGGAFNILDQIYKANEFLRNNSSCPASETGCTTFTVAPKINIFWSPGVDPGTSYLGLSYPISAYLRDATANFKGLYILGGKDGDYNCTDTDHFDNSIILHEYGHFLEEFYAKSESPGGSHSGNGVIDPRLAWSEGWANFFQAAVLGQNSYQDTIRNSSCTSATPATKLQINLILDEQRNRQDVPIASGEGVFRETSVSRSLYQAMNSTGASGYGADLGFALIWRAFTNSSFGGMADSSYKFRNIGMFNKFLYSLTQANQAAKLTNYNNVLTYEKQPADFSAYATPISLGSCSDYSITGGKTYDGSAANPAVKLTNPDTTTWSMHQSTRFYAYNWPGGNFLVKLNYTHSGTRPDLDLYVYNEEHVLFNSSKLAGSSTNSPGQEPTESGRFVETVNIPNLPAGTYLLHVVMDEGTSYDGVTAQFSLTNSSGAKLCP